MSTLAPVKKMATMVAVLASVILFSCSKDKDDGDSSGYPKEVSIEYKVSSPSGMGSSDVMYTNETGGNSNIDNAALPFSKKFKRTVKQYDVLVANISTLGNGEIKLEILVNDKVVKSETFSGTSVIMGSMAYTFP